MLRAKTGVKVRQPLSALELFKTEISGENKNILMEELNVKEVKTVNAFSAGVVFEGEVGLNTLMTEELKQEGWLRELLRLIQGARQEAGLTPQDKIKLYLDLPETFAFLKTKSEEIIKETNSVSAEFMKQAVEFEKRAEIDGGKIWIGIKK